MCRARVIYHSMLRQTDIVSLDSHRIDILPFMTETTGCEIDQRRIHRVLSHAGLPAVEVRARVYENTPARMTTAESG